MNHPNLEQDLLLAELERIKTDAEKLRAETMKLQKEARWQPWLGIIIALIASVTALITTLINALGK